MPTVYTTPDAIAAYLGRTLSSDQEGEATTIATAVGTYFDRVTGGWGAGTATQQQPLRLADVYLPVIPVTGLTTVQNRSMRVGDPWTDLTADIDFELLDSACGWVRFTHWGPYVLVKIVYTYDKGVAPADLTEAATEIAAATVLSTIFTDRVGISRIQLDPTTIVQYSNGQKLFVTDSAREILDSYSPKVIIG